MNPFLEFMHANPFLRASWDILCVTLPLAMLLAFAGTSCMTVAAQCLAARRRRASYARGARQLSLLGLILGWLLLTGSRVWLFLDETDYALLPSILPGFSLLEPVWFLLGGAVLAISVCHALWKTLSPMPALHISLGLLCCLLACLALAAALVAARCLAMCPQAGEAASLKSLFMPGIEQPYWSALCMTLPLSLALAAGCGASWLPLLRRRDDFGRDHYNTMVAWCATWARNAWILLWLLLFFSSAQQIWLHWPSGGFSPTAALHESLQLLLWLLPAPLWAWAAHSALPLRHRLSMFLALLIGIIFVYPYCQKITGLHTVFGPLF